MEELGPLSLLPPVVAIVLAMITRRVVASLGAALVVGGALLAYQRASGWAVVSGTFHEVWTEQLYANLRDWDRWRVFLFSVLLGAMVGVIEFVGGMEALVRGLVRRVRSRRSGQTLVWLLGLGVFFDDYANTLLLGTTMRGTADRLGFSRAKLAYLVDSTAAPVAGLALVSTWVATEISYIAEGLAAASVAPEVTAFGVFVESIPYRFYAILALVLVAIVALTGRDFRAMASEEHASVRRAAERQGVLDADGEAMRAEAHRPRWLWLAAVVPVVVCVSTVMGVLVATGVASVASENPEIASTAGGWEYWGRVIGNGDSYGGLLWGSIAGLATALVAGVLARQQSWRSWSRGVGWGMVRGAVSILPAMLVLWLAWSLSGMTGTEKLDTGGYLGEVLRTSGMPGWILPTAVFVVAGFVALATGTSWGTMGLLTPLSVQLAVSAGAGMVGDAAAMADGGPLLLPVVGAVLAGSIFGDHCSPISDTTVLSSRASGCDHILHVRTQLPYAVLAGVVAILCGTLPSGFGFPTWASLLGGCAVMLVAMLVMGTVAEREDAAVDGRPRGEES